MRSSSDWNFAGCLIQRLRENSHLIDAATGETVPGREVPGMIVSVAAGFLSLGLQPGDRILISCGLSPASRERSMGGSLFSETH